MTAEPRMIHCDDAPVPTMETQDEADRREARERAARQERERIAAACAALGSE